MKCDLGTPRSEGAHCIVYHTYKTRKAALSMVERETEWCRVNGLDDAWLQYQFAVSPEGKGVHMVYWHNCER